VDKVKVIQVGLSNIGQGVTKALVKKKGVEIVGAVDIAEDKVGKDLGEVAGVGTQLGVIVTDDADSLFSETYADVVIHTTTICPLHEVYQQIIKPIERGMNIITASVEAINPFFVDPGVAAKLDKLTREHGVTFLGIGDNGVTIRLVMALTELCTEIDKIKLTTYSSVASSSEGAKRLYGIGLTVEEYQRGIDEGTVVRHSQLGLVTISDHLGWQLDEVKLDFEPLLSEDGRIIEMHVVWKGIKDGKVKIEREIIPASKHGRSHEIIIESTEGVPSINAVIKCSPEHTYQTTVAPLVNAIPHVINAPPGIMKVLDLPPAFVLLGDMRALLSDERFRT